MSLGIELFTQLRSSKKCHDLNVTTPVAYASGYMPLDYINGQRVTVYDENDEIIEEYDSTGFVDGTMVTVVADSGLGKTTLVEQIAVNIIRPFENAFIQHEDIEQASHINRIANITGMKPGWIKKHYLLYQDTHTEAVIDRIMDHAKMKINNRKVFEYDTGLKDMYGNNIKRLIPTVVIIDSLAVMRSESSSFQEDGKSKNSDDIDSTTNNMAGSRNAKFNSEVFKQILPFIKKANIILFVINHITRKIQTGFIQGPRDLVGLGDNESLPGGRASIYLANNVLRLKNKGSLKPDKEYGINGHIIDATFYKSRTNASNVSCELIFDKSKGFSPALTMLHFGLNNDLVKKSGTKYYVLGCEDVTFTKKNFLTVAAMHPEILDKLYELALPIVQTYLGTIDNYDDDESEDSRNDSYISIMNMID